MPRTAKEETEVDLLITKLHVALQKSVDEMTLEVYSEALEDIPMATLRQTVHAAIRTAKFMPTVGELRILAGFDVTGGNRAIAAFAELAKAVSRHGPYKTIRFNDPLMNQTIQDLGGWVRVCETPDSVWYDFFRKRFIETYVANHDSRRGTMSAQLGISQMGNSGSGIENENDKTIEYNVGLPRLERLSYDPPKTDKRLGLSGIAGLLKDASKQGDRP